MTRLGSGVGGARKMHDQGRAFDVQKQCHGLAGFDRFDRFRLGPGECNDVAHRLNSKTTTLSGPLIVTEYGHNQGIFSVNGANVVTI